MFILASSSPRRRELMKQIVDEYKIIPSNFDEGIFSSLFPMEAVHEIAKSKGEEVSLKYPDDVVISADTIVVIDNKLIGKPIDEDDACRILNLLSNKEHQVITSFCIFKGKLLYQEEVISDVLFYPLTDALIKDYVKSKSPLDKAGAYGVQDNEKYPLVKEIKGSVDNVIGFPTKEIKEALIRLKLL